MVRNLGTNKILWFLTASFSLAAALVGVLNNDIYSKVISNDIMLKVSQDPSFMPECHCWIDFGRSNGRINS